MGLLEQTEKSAVQRIHRDAPQAHVWRHVELGRGVSKDRKNIGVAPEAIEVEIKKLCEDTEAQLKEKSRSIDEIAARFHHRLVYIHPFPNGNGRFARTMTDLLLVQHDSARFTWGAGDLISNTSEVRKRYISALRAADGRKYSELFAFVRDS